jgi:hypothetical protein
VYPVGYNGGMTNNGNNAKGTKMAMQVSQFDKSGAFACRQCGRRCRNTGRGNNSACGLCGHCYEQVVIEDQMMEEGELPELLSKRESLIAACKRAGGKPDQSSYFARKIG